MSRTFLAFASILLFGIAPISRAGEVKKDIQIFDSKVEARLCAFAMANLNSHLESLIDLYWNKLGAEENTYQTMCEMKRMGYITQRQFQAFRFSRLSSILSQYKIFGWSALPYPRRELLAMLKSLESVSGQIWISRLNKALVALTRRGELVLVLPRSGGPGPWIHEGSHVRVTMQVSKSLQAMGFGHNDAIRTAVAIGLTPYGRLLLEAEAVHDELAQEAPEIRALGVEGILELGNYPIITAIAGAYQTGGAVKEALVTIPDSEKGELEKAAKAFDNDMNELLWLLFQTSRERRLALAGEFRRLAIEAAIEETGNPHVQLPTSDEIKYGGRILNTPLKARLLLGFEMLYRELPGSARELYAGVLETPDVARVSGFAEFLEAHYAQGPP
jgi:hypothetical protein